MMIENPELERFKLEQRVKSGASWFYWVAALSAVNAFAGLVESSWSFFIGLALTQLLTGLTVNASEAIHTAVLFINLGAAGLFVWIGKRAQRERLSFAIGMAIYAIDGLVPLLLGLWLEFGFHVFALFGMWQGYKALGISSALEANVEVPVAVDTKSS